MSLICAYIRSWAISVNVLCFSKFRLLTLACNANISTHSSARGDLVPSFVIAKQSILWLPGMQRWKRLIYWRPCLKHRDFCLAVLSCINKTGKFRNQLLLYMQLVAGCSGTVKCSWRQVVCKKYLSLRVLGLLHHLNVLSAVVPLPTEDRVENKVWCVHLFQKIAPYNYNMFSLSRVWENKTTFCSDFNSSDCCTC